MGKIKIILLISSLVFLTFGNCLNNNLIGDDKAIFVEGAFYKHPSNIPRLLSPAFVMKPGPTPQKIVVETSFSGFVSYRPVVALTFFLDEGLWHGQAFGYHLDNLLLHLFACILIYFFLLRITAAPHLALLAVLLFSVHPIQSEVVNAIGYRADILVTIFYLLSFLSYIKTTSTTAPANIKWLALSALSFFAALLSKESALTFPAMIFLYDRLIRPRNSVTASQSPSIKSYWPYLILSVIYLVIYFILMPNAYYLKFPHQSFSLFQQAAINLKILFTYLLVLIWPLKISILPPLYAPSSASVTAIEIIFPLVCLILSFAIALRRRVQNPLITFAILWFWLNYLPVANIVPLLNPYAFRFMYLPSIGFFILASLLIKDIIDRLTRKFAGPNSSLNLEFILKAGIIGLYLAATIPNNEFFKNDIVACREMLCNYPDSSRPYWNLAINYLDRKEYPKAIENFQRYLASNPRNPFLPDVKNDFLAYHMLGQCYPDDPKKAVELFETSIRLNPDFVISYTDAAKAYILLSDYEKSLDRARQAIRINNDVICGYYYAIHSYVMLNKIPEAQELWREAIRVHGKDSNLDYLAALIESKKK